MHDGAVVGGVTDPELLTRWTTAGAFLGWFRNHYDGYNKAFQEPYRYDEPYRSACRKYIEMRYELLQLFYSLLHEAAVTGLPICRPMFLTDRHDPAVYDHLDDQFMLGPDLLVAPVLERGSLGRDVYLPAGSDWYAYTNARAPLSEATPGGRSVAWYVPIDLVPLYVRAGAIIPRRELEQWVGERTTNALTFECYPGPDTTRRVYLDDGTGRTHATSAAYRLLAVSRSSDHHQDRVTVTREHDGFAPLEPFFYVSLPASDRPAAVLVQGRRVADLSRPEDAVAAALLTDSSVNAYYVNASLRTVFIKRFDDADMLSIVIVRTT